MIRSPNNLCLFFSLFLLFGLTVAVASPPGPSCNSTRQEIDALLSENLPEEAAELARISKSDTSPDNEFAGFAELAASLSAGPESRLRALSARPGVSKALRLACLAQLPETSMKDARLLAGSGLDAKPDSARLERLLRFILAVSLLRQDKIYEAGLAFTGNGQAAWNIYTILLALTPTHYFDRAGLLDMAVKGDFQNHYVQDESILAALRHCDFNSTMAAFEKVCRLRRLAPPRTTESPRKPLGFASFSLLTSQTAPIPCADTVWAELAFYAANLGLGNDAALCLRRLDRNNLSSRALYAAARAAAGINDPDSALSISGLMDRGPDRHFVRGLADMSLGKIKDAAGYFSAAESSPAGKRRHWVRQVEIRLYKALCAAMQGNSPGALELLATLDFNCRHRIEYWQTLALCKPGDPAGIKRHVLVLAGTGILPVRLAEKRLGFIPGLRNALESLPEKLCGPRPRPTHRIAAFSYRILADRAAIDGKRKLALLLLRVAKRRLAKAALEDYDLDPRSSLSATEIHYLQHSVPAVLAQIATLEARIQLSSAHTRAAHRALRPALDIALPHYPGLFVMSASAYGIEGKRFQMSAALAAGSILGLRQGTCWREIAQLALYAGNEAVFHAMARFIAESPARGDSPSDVVAILGLGGLNLEALDRWAPMTESGACLGKALALNALGNTEKARHLLCACIKKNSMWKRAALYHLVRIALSDNDLEKARQYTGLLKSAGGFDAFEELARAEFLLKRRDRLPALEAAVGALERTPASAAPLILQARINKTFGRPFDGLLKEATQRAPHLPEAWEELGRPVEAARAWLVAGNFKKAVYHLSRLRNSNSDTGLHNSRLHSAFSRLYEYSRGKRRKYLARLAALALLKNNGTDACLAMARRGMQAVDGSCRTRVYSARRSLSPGPATIIFLTTLLLLPRLLAGRLLCRAIDLRRSSGTGDQ